ncbi:protein timeless [Caerostris extrusa]|uniref:Protein timeless n=1 Tax=Caerostris extrusa TaxID=172846 RepID=A0AAV4W3D2_CAEEX|nr:protein timeless [Caerostris extrusa]
MFSTHRKSKVSLYEYPGSEVRGVYEKGTDCLECLRDLLQYLRKSDEDHSVLRFLGSNHLIETDILPILKRYKDEKEIFDFALRLLVALTSPALLLFNEEIPEDKASHNIYLELVATTNEIRSGTEKEKDAEALAAIREREQNLKTKKKAVVSDELDKENPEELWIGIASDLSAAVQVAENKKVFVELLFWKGRKEAYELEEGYGHPQPSTARGAWTEEEEEELKYLYEENKDIHIEGQDVADIILANINHKLRTKHQIILALKRLD